MDKPVSASKREQPWWRRDPPWWAWWIPEGFIFMGILIGLLIWGFIAAGPTLWTLLGLALTSALITVGLLGLGKDDVEDE